MSESEFKCDSCIHSEVCYHLINLEAYHDNFDKDCVDYVAEENN